MPFEKRTVDPSNYQIANVAGVTTAAAFGTLAGLSCSTVDDTESAPFQENDVRNTQRAIVDTTRDASDPFGYRHRNEVCCDAHSHLSQASEQFLQAPTSPKRLTT